MVIHPNMPWLRMLVSIHGTSLTRTLPRILVFTLFSVIVTVIELRFGIERFTLTIAPFTLIGLALSIFLGFRNNAAYDRYWEGRKLWGQLVNSSRSFTREVLMFVNHPDDLDAAVELEVENARRELVRKEIAYIHALRHHLRDSDPTDDLYRLLSVEDAAAVLRHKNVPNAVLLNIGAQLASAYQRGWVTEYHVAQIERTLVTLMDCQGGCERIKNTPIPWPYTVLIHRIVAFYCLALPFGLVKDIGILTPVVVMLISHAFFGLDEIGTEIEGPFGTQPQHLPLAALSRTIEVNLLESIEAESVPPLLRPENGVLL